MKKLLPLSVPILVMAYALFSSCVPTRKLKSAQSKIDRLKQDSAATHTNLNTCLANVNTLENEKKRLQNEKAGLLNDKTGLKSKNDSIQNDLNNLSTTSKLTIEEQAARLKMLQDMIQAQKNTLNNLKKTISDALINFKADELSVSIKDGNVYVSLEEKLLFKSGSSDVDPKGKQALAKLAEVMNSTKDITMMIEGHTDNVPIKTAKFQDNWSLSTERALSIVRILTKEDGFDSRRIIASGRGEFHPVQLNETVAGRASNRRTEIILTPNLTELFKLLAQ
jgi:chemotaxis protein MotB